MCAFPDCFYYIVLVEKLSVIIILLRLRQILLLLIRNMKKYFCIFLRFKEILVESFLYLLFKSHY